MCGAGWWVNDRDEPCVTVWAGRLLIRSRWCVPPLLHTLVRERDGNDHRTTSLSGGSISVVGTSGPPWLLSIRLFYFDSVRDEADE